MPPAPKREGPPKRGGSWGKPEPKPLEWRAAAAAAAAAAEEPEPEPEPEEPPELPEERAAAAAEAWEEEVRTGTSCRGGRQHARGAEERWQRGAEGERTAAGPPESTEGMQERGALRGGERGAAGRTHSRHTRARATARALQGGASDSEGGARGARGAARRADSHQAWHGALCVLGLLGEDGGHRLRLHAGANVALLCVEAVQQVHIMWPGGTGGAAEAQREVLGMGHGLSEAPRGGGRSQTSSACQSPSPACACQRLQCSCCLQSAPERRREGGERTSVQGSKAETVRARRERGGGLGGSAPLAGAAGRAGGSAHLDLDGQQGGQGAPEAVKLHGGGREGQKAER